MSDNSEKALRFFNEGYNCCQSVVGALVAPDTVQHQLLLKTGAAFGGGMRRGEVCGAVVGALMALGVSKAGENPADPDAKKLVNARTIAFMKEFENRHGSYLCRELIKSAGKKVCDQAIQGAVLLFEELEAQSDR